jgi:SAM-dependent methyltransferase
MNVATPVAQHFGSDLFDGAAYYFARYQADYPPALFRFLHDDFGLNQASSVLDLGCGTGQIGVPLASGVKRTVCVDPDKAMLVEARNFAHVRNVANVQFIEGHSEELRADIGTFRLATLAGCFHWMDRPRVLALLDSLIETDGGVAIISRERHDCEPGNWWDALWKYVERFWGGYFPAGKNAVRPLLASSSKDILLRSPFANVREVPHPYEYLWHLDDLVGYVFSTSKACPGVLGERRPEFEAGLLCLFKSLSPTGLFIERGHTATLAALRPA